MNVLRDLAPELSVFLFLIVLSGAIFLTHMLSR